MLTARNRKGNTEAEEMKQLETNYLGFEPAKGSRQNLQRDLWQPELSIWSPWEGGSYLHRGLCMASSEPVDNPTKIKACLYYLHIYTTYTTNLYHYTSS